MKLKNIPIRAARRRAARRRFLHGCGYRAEAAPLASNAPAAAGDYARADGNAGFHGGIPSR